MNSKPSRVKNARALCWLVLILGLLAWAGWSLWQSRAPDAAPPILPFVACALAVAILFDD